MDNHDSVPQCRHYFRLAREIVANAETEMAEFDRTFKKKKQRLLYRIVLTSVSGNVKQRRKLTNRLEAFCKVSNMSALSVKQ